MAKNQVNITYDIGLTLAERKSSSSYYEDDYYERPDSFYFFLSTNILEAAIATRNKSTNGMWRMI